MCVMTKPPHLPDNVCTDDYAPHYPSRGLYMISSADIVAVRILYFLLAIGHLGNVLEGGGAAVAVVSGHHAGQMDP